jgi:hypothetical protein
MRVDRVPAVGAAQAAAGVAGCCVAELAAANALRDVAAGAAGLAVPIVKHHPARVLYM